MRIRRQSSTGLHLAAKILQLLFGDAAFQISSRVNAGGGVTLEIDDVAIAVFCLRAEEMIEGDFVESCGRSKRGDVPANTFLNFVGADHNSQRVPAHQA